MRQAHTFALSLTALLIASCGGGGGGSSSGNSSTSLTVQGTAATGAAINGGTVDVKCASGTGTATTSATGAYTVSVLNGSLPCMVKVTPATGPALYSVALGTGSTATVNVTPITQLVLASLGQDPATLYGSFTSSSITSSSLDAAKTKAIAVLTSNGVDTSALPDPLTGTLVAANGSTTGSPYDLALDALAAKLVNGVTLTTLATTLVQQNSATPGNTVAPPAELALQPAAASCASARSGTYRSITPKVGDAGAIGDNATELDVVDMTALTVVAKGGANGITLVPVANDPCRFTIAQAGVTTGGEVVFSPAGVVVSRGPTAGGSLLGIGFPEQTIALADLAGTWNTLGFSHVDTPSTNYQAQAARATIDSNGNITAANFCAGAVTTACVDVPLTTRTMKLTVNPAGGFTRTSTDPANAANNWSDRFFAYRSGSGDMMLVNVDGGGNINVSTRDRTLGQPAVGTFSRGWTLLSTPATTGNSTPAMTQPKAGALSPYENTITAPPTGAAANQFTRANVTGFGTPQVTKPETLFQNVMGGGTRNGYTWRQPATGVLDSANSRVNVSEFTSMGLRGMGFSAIFLPAPTATAHQYGFSVNKP
ncbi:MAG: hypothetical protein RIQ60_964 [Pseudomonadota bacterium]